MLPDTLRARPIAVDVLARLVRQAGIGDLHPVLAPDPMWLDTDEETAAEAAAADEIGGRWLRDRTGRLDIELVDSLAVLTRPTVEYYGWITHGETTIGVLAASTPAEALLAVRDGDDVRLRQIRRTTLPEHLVGQLPDVPPARGEFLEARQADLIAAPRGRLRTTATIRTASPRIRLIQRVAALPTTGGAHLNVATRDPAGRRTTARHPLRIADTEHGRWSNITTGGRDPHVRIGPATLDEITNRLRAMCRALP